MMNPMQLMQMMRSGGNPQQALITMMKRQAGNNPVMNNAIHICNVVADYAQHIFFETYRLLGGKAIFYMPGIIERLVA